MGYTIKFDDITSLQVASQSTLSEWNTAIGELNTAMAGLLNDAQLQGQAMSSIRTYLAEVHGTLLQSLVQLMQTYSADLLLYKDGYYKIDNQPHAELPHAVFNRLSADLRASHTRLKGPLSDISSAKSKISDLVSYSGKSDILTEIHYQVLEQELTKLDTSIQQYEDNHARQDLSTFKDLLQATSNLLMEYSGQSRQVTHYQAGDLAQLTSIQEFAVAYRNVEHHLSANVERIEAAQERDQARFEALAAEERTKQGWANLVLGVVTIAVGLSAIVASGGAATPLVAGLTYTAGVGTTLYGASNTSEAAHNIELGYKGDGVTAAFNPLQDTLFMGNKELYHQVGGFFTTASSIMIPIGQTGSVTKGLFEFTAGELGSQVLGQVSYHGTKLLGGSEADAQRASFIGNLVGGYAGSSAATKFSLNHVEAPKVKAQVEAPTYNKEQILKNLEESRKAREASNFDEYLQKEKFQQTLLGMDEMDRQRYLQWHKYAEAGISPSDRVRVLEISENAPKVEYRAGVSQDSVLNTTKGDRPNVEDVYKQSYIEAHQQQFKDGAARFQKFQPSEGWNNGIVGGDDGTSFWLSTKDADIIQDVAKGDNRLYETLLGFDEGYLGNAPLYRLDVSPEVVSEKGVSIPSGNEKGANKWWRPGGRTYPGDMPEGVMSGISTKEGDHIWNIVN